MGKREIGELSILDLVVFIMIAEMAVMAIEQPTDALMNTLLPMIVLLLIQITLAWISMKSKRFRDLVDGKPTILINKGKIDEGMMRKQRYNFDDLLLQLRENNVSNIADVEFAILEPSGKLSVIEKDKNTNEQDITLPLILDGEINEENIKTIGKSLFWLRKELKDRGYPNTKDISFCSYQNGEFYIDLTDQ
ncbi:DUF421 domain-containing protein [Falsibacillus albus]|uniref:DUF421 domain-containing protein n=2 Tax=Falsibacillus albus TaxID=2478915 RepID=A0A3L7K8B8_9BACI|nr:DUF421 domain-containing protein [Falsibacillus albus]